VRERRRIDHQPCLDLDTCTTEGPPDLVEERLGFGRCSVADHEHAHPPMTDQLPGAGEIRGRAERVPRAVARNARR
jgi:hypothetical protein